MRKQTIALVDGTGNYCGLRETPASDVSFRRTTWPIYSRCHPAIFPRLTGVASLQRSQTPNTARSKWSTCSTADSSIAVCCSPQTSSTFIPTRLRVGRRLAANWTTCVDTACYTADVALDEWPVLNTFQVAGEVLDFQGIVHAYETGSGKPLRVERLGSPDDLSARIEQLQKGGPTNFPLYFSLMCYRSMLNGEGKLDELMNDRYPSIRTTTVREYVAHEGL